MATDLVLPVVLAVGSALCYATAAAVQRGENARAPREATWRDALRSLLRRRRWWIGVGVMAVGAVLHVTALGLGSVTLVQPVGVLSLVLALPLDARLNRRRVVRAEWISAALLVAALAALLTMAPHTDRSEVPRPAVLLLTLAIVVGVVAVLAVGVAPLRPRLRGAGRAAGTGVCMGTTSVAAHVATDALTGQPAQVALGLTLAGAGLLLPVLGLGLLQLGYRDGGLDGPQATLTLTDPLVAATLGIVVLGERPAGGATGAVVAALAGAVAVGALVALVRAGPAGDTGEPVSGTSQAARTARNRYRADPSRS